MKIFGVAKLTCLLALTSQMMFAGSGAEKVAPSKCSVSPKTGTIAKSHTKGNRYATAAFSNSTYTTTVLAIGSGAGIFSKNRNFGQKSGAIELTDDGVKILERGDYWVDFSATYNLDESDSSTQIIVQKSKDFDLNNPLNVIGNSVHDVDSLSNNDKVCSGAGILRDVAPGTKLSLVIRSLGDSSDIATVGYWKLSVFEIKN